MILGIGRDEDIRKTFEYFVVDELRRHRIAAQASHTIIPDLAKTTRAEIVAAVRAAGCDAVLTTRAIAIGDSNVTQQGASGSVYGAGARSSYDFLKATLQASLYDAETQELVWSSTIKTFDAREEVRVSRELGGFFFESLRRDGLL